MMPGQVHRPLCHRNGSRYHSAGFQGAVQSATILSPKHVRSGVGGIMQDPNHRVDRGSSPTQGTKNSFADDAGGHIQSLLLQIGYHAVHHAVSTERLENIAEPLPHLLIWI